MTADRAAHDLAEGSRRANAYGVRVEDLAFAAGSDAITVTSIRR
jgi:hypothetical protein